jgi:signal transduction histidine kinase/ligand-binding sensor domain-containing protein
MTWKIGVLLAAALCGMPARTMAAGEAPPLAEDYRITTWAAGDGITLGDVLAITQDRDGYLWLAAGAGLVRFDGLRFKRDDIVAGRTPLPAAPARTVYAARDGSLWVGYGDAEGIYRIKDGEVRNIYLKEQLSGPVNVITEGKDGSIWVGHDHGLEHFRRDQWTTVPLPAAYAHARVLDVHEDRGGTLWVGTDAALLRAAPGQALEIAPHGEIAVRAISEDPAGNVWITDEFVGVRRAGSPSGDAPIDGRGMGLFHDRSGTLWVTTRGQGLWQIKRGSGGPTVKRATVQSGLQSDESSAIFEDRDGTIWVGSIEGLNRLVPHRVLSLVELGVVQSLALEEGRRAWIGTTTGLLELRGATASSPGQSRVVATTPVQVLHTASDGTVWAATAEGLQRVVDERLEPVRAGRHLRHISAIASGPRGVLWITDEREGVVRIAANRAERIEQLTAGVTAPPVLAYVDKADRVWVAFRGGLLRQLDAAGHVREWQPGGELAHSIVYTVHHDRYDQLWVGGNRGLSRLVGDRFQTFTFYNQVPGRSVTGIVDDDRGNLWVGVSFAGFIRLVHADAVRATQDPRFSPRYRMYTPASGAGATPSATYGNSTRIDAQRGALWIMTTRGVTVADLGSLSSSQDGAPKRPRIEGVTVDDQHYAAIDGLALPPGTNRLRIDYTAVSLSSSERVRFRYRLDGFDTGWVDGTGARQAQYTNLSPGSYRFRLQASTNSADWNDAQVAWAFSMQPMFYQTRWFYALCVLALGLCAGGAWQLRIRQVRKEMAIVYGERLRLGREIHDTLLQSLYGIALQLDVAASELRDSTSPTRTHLRRLRQQTEDYISEARRSIWELRSHALERRDLVSALRESAERLTDGHVPFVLTVTGTPRRCPPHLETQVLRIGHEAVMNAVRHAHARQVEMTIAFEDDRVRLRVADDGRGFGQTVPRATEIARAGHYGLASMQERAAEAGGRCTITSAPGTGVEVIAEFPLDPAMSSAAPR